MRASSPQTRALRLIAILTLWLCASSFVLTTRDATKSLQGRAALAPEGSQHVQVREHELFGVRVTEVVLGPAALDDELPMLVHFHGRGDKPTLPSGDHGGTPATRLLFPWAPDALGDGFTWFSLSVTDRSKPEKVLGHHIRERADQVAKVLEEMMRRRPTEGRAMVTGFSQGGMMTFALALRHPELIDGAVPVAGWLPRFLVDEAMTQNGPETRYPPIRAMHGRGDSIVTLEPTIELIDDLKARGLDAALEIFEWDEHSMNKSMHARHRELILSLIERMRRRRVGIG